MRAICRLATPTVGRGAGAPRVAVRARVRGIPRLAHHTPVTDRSRRSSRPSEAFKGLFVVDTQRSSCPSKSSMSLSIGACATTTMTMWMRIMRARAVAEQIVLGGVQRATRRRRRRRRWVMKKEYNHMLFLRATTARRRSFCPCPVPSCVC